jgi:hypothetical protein
MRRRDFITLIGSAAAWPLAARAQQPAMPVVGFLGGVSPTDTTRALRRGLQETGYVEGKNVAIEYRWAENQLDRLPALAADLVRKRVAVIVATGGTAPAVAAKAATTTIPIVFTVPEDPVQLGLVASLSRPGGNLTGVNLFVGELVPKRLELLRELVPAMTRVAVLVNPAYPARAELQVREAESAGRAMGLQIQIFRAGSGPEINTVFASLVRERPDQACAACHSGGPACDTNVVFGARPCRCRWTDELWDQHSGWLSSSRRVHRPRPQGRKARRFANRAVEQVRTRHQRTNGPHARPHCACVATYRRRRGDRVSEFCCTAYVG